MKFSIRKYIMAFFILIVTFALASEQKIPNIKVLENPEKEITTVEGLKNREAAEMNIKVKKRDIEEIEGYESGNYIIFTLPSETKLKNKMKVEEDIRVVKRFDDKLKDKRLRRTKDQLPIADTPFELEERDGKKIVKIQKKDIQEEAYIVKLAKDTKEVQKVYRGKVDKRGAIKSETIDLGEYKLEVDSRLFKIEGYERITNNTGGLTIDPTAINSVRNGYQRPLFVKTTPNKKIPTVNNKYGSYEIKWQSTVDMTYRGDLAHVAALDGDGGLGLDFMLPFKTMEDNRPIDDLYKLGYHGNYKFDLSNLLQENIGMYRGLDGNDYKIKFIRKINRENETYKSGRGTLNIDNLSIDSSISFDKTSGAGEVASIENPEIKLNLTGQLPEPKGLESPNIADRMTVTINGTSYDVSSKIYANNKYELELLESGNLKIKKIANGVYNDTIMIEYMYVDAILGEFTLELSNNRTDFEIIGSDVIDFGNILQGTNKNIESNIKIKNLGTEKIIRVSLESDSMELLKKDGNEILNVSRSVQMGTPGTEVPVKINLVARPRENQGLGEYEGEMNLYVDIE